MVHQTEKKICPRCKQEKEFYKTDALNSTSRTDTKTKICKSCALDESLGNNVHEFDKE